MQHDLREIEAKLDRLFDLRRVEAKLDLLLRDRVDRDRIDRLAGQLRRATAGLARAVADAGSALPADELESLLSHATQTHEMETTTMSAEIDRLAQEVAENKTVMTSAIALLSGLSQRVRDTAGDRATAMALADEMDANSNALAAAVTANTPSEGEPAPAPQAAPKKRS